MRLREVAAFGRSHTECLFIPFWYLRHLPCLPFIPCACLESLHVPYATYLDSFSILVFKVLVLHVDLQSEYFNVFSPTFSLTHPSKSSQFTFPGCHAPQVVILGHIWSHQCPYWNFQFPIFPITTGILDQSGCDEIERSCCFRKELYWMLLIPNYSYQTSQLD